MSLPSAHILVNQRGMIGGILNVELTEKVNAIRRPDVVDIVERLVVITPDRINVENYPIKKPLTLFNASFCFEGDYMRIFARASFGYYTYTSSIIEFKVPMDHLENGFCGEYSAEITIFPDNRYDFWGVEDPRYYRFNGRELLTYCGRTESYFESSPGMEKTLPVTAVRKENEWVKRFVFRVPSRIRNFIVSDKNAFLFESREGTILFHRLHLLNGRFYLVASSVGSPLPFNGHGMAEIETGDALFVLDHHEFETKLGWGTPPVEVEEGSYLVLIHSVGKDKVYRVFPALMDERGLFTAVSPFFIMEPKETYEKYGDRPYVIFPCGAHPLGEKLYITYGAADSVIGIGSLEIDRLLEILRKGKIDHI